MPDISSDVEQLSVAAAKIENCAEILIDFVKKSIGTDKKDLIYRARNSLTLLSSMKISLSGMDFSGIKVPGANLSYSFL